MSRHLKWESDVCRWRRFIPPPAGGNTQVKTYSQEVRLLSHSGGRLNWLLGAYAFHLDGFMDTMQQSSAGPGSPIVTTLIDAEIKTTSYSGFAEGTYEVLDNLFLTAGGRYTNEKRKFRQQLNGIQRLFGSSDTAEKSFNKWTYRGALRYQFAEKGNIFVSYGTGFKSGVFNALGPGSEATAPETINALEGGIKVDPTRWLRTNLSVYTYDYKDLQFSGRPPGVGGFAQVVTANAKIYGGELEVTMAPTNDLNLRGSYAYIHGEYEDFLSAPTFIPRPDGGNTSVFQDVSGNRVARAPRHKITIGFDWGVDVGGGRMQLAGNLARSRKVYYDFANLFVQKPYTLASGEISWAPNDRWRFSLWGKNLTNEVVVQQLRVGAPSADVVYEQPRHIGIGAELRF